MFKIAICEDEKIHMNINKVYVERWSNKNSIPVKISEFFSAEEFIFKSLEKNEYDLILIDIKIKNSSGIDLAKLIREKDKTINIIFITGFSQYCLYGYDVNAINYLIKPLNEKKLFQSLDRAFENFKNINKISNSILIKTSNEVLRVALNDIIYCQSFEHYLDIYTENKIYTIKKRISDLEKELDKPYFVRCHRSYIININYIKNINTNNVILSNNIIVPISKSRKKYFKELYFKCF